MKLCWKVLIPVSLAWILIVATIRTWRSAGGSIPVYIVAGLIVTVLISAGWAASTAAVRREARTSQQAATSAPDVEPSIPFPVPPLDLPHYHRAGPATGTASAPAVERPEHQEA
jgi:NADH-quinone oxidoreductase subunit H